MKNLTALLLIAIAITACRKAPHATGATRTKGGAAATTGDRVIQDHLTGLEWYRPGTLPTAVNWNDAIDAALALILAAWLATKTSKQ